MKMPLILIAALGLTFGCHKFDRRHHCDRCREYDCDDDDDSDYCERTCGGHEPPSAAPAAAPAAAPVQQAIVAQAPMFAQAPMMMAAPAYAPAAAPQSAHAAFGLDFIKIPLPVPKLYAIPSAAPPVAAPQVMMMPQMPMMAAPYGFGSFAAAPPVMAAPTVAAAPPVQQCTSAAPAAAPAADSAALERRANELESRLDTLIHALENNP